MKWTIERISVLPSSQIVSLYRNAVKRGDPESLEVAELIVQNGLLKDESGGLPFDHPLMLEIESICAQPEAIAEALAAAEKGDPPLSGMEYRLVDALGSEYGGHYTTHHAGRCIGAAMLDRGWTQNGLKPMPKGSVAKSATVYLKKATK